MDIPKTKGGNEPYTFTLYPTSKETSSSKELLRSIKVDQRKCKDDTAISSLLGASYFTMKVARATFTTYVVVPR
jgi:hypothetical protein